MPWEAPLQAILESIEGPVAKIIAVMIIIIITGLTLAFETGSEARAGIGTWISYYNEKRPHSSHGLLTPSEAYDTSPQPLKTAA